MLLLQDGCLMSKMKWTITQSGRVGVNYTDWSIILGYIFRYIYISIQVEVANYI